MKVFNEFYKDKSRKDGFSNACKKCHDEITSKWRLNNKDKVSKYRQRSYIKNKIKHIESNRRWQGKNPDKLKIYFKKFDAKTRSSPKGKLNDNISRSIRQSLNGTKGNRPWESLVNFTIDQLKKHLEKQFTDEMTWENYGKFWHIDHKLPVSVFNFEKSGDIDFNLCWSLKNLQPLEAITNIKKRAKIERSFQLSLHINMGVYGFG